MQVHGLQNKRPYCPASLTTKKRALPPSGASISQSLLISSLFSVSSSAWAPSPLSPAPSTRAVFTCFSSEQCDQPFYYFSNLPPFSPPVVLYLHSHNPHGVLQKAAILAPTSCANVADLNASLWGRPVLHVPPSISTQKGEFWPWTSVYSSHQPQNPPALKQ